MTLCPYVHDIKPSCRNVNKQHRVQLEEEKKGAAQSDGWAAKTEPTAQEIKREERRARKGRALKDKFTCANLAYECEQGHDHQAARLASHALLDKHMHVGRVTQGIETETFEEKREREKEERRAAQPKKSKLGEGVEVPAEANETLVFSKMSCNTTEEGLKEAVEEYGTVKRINILKNDEGRSRGKAFVDFTNKEDATAALNGLQGQNLDGRTPIIEFKGAPGSGGGGGGPGGCKGCFNCGQEGHRKNECPQPKKGGGSGGGPITCYSCHQEGHISRECPSKNGGSGGGYDAGGYDSGPVNSSGADWDVPAEDYNAPQESSGWDAAPAEDANGGAKTGGSSGW